MSDREPDAWDKAQGALAMAAIIMWTLLLIDIVAHLLMA